MQMHGQSDSRYKALVRCRLTIYSAVSTLGNGRFCVKGTPNQSHGLLSFGAFLSSSEYMQAQKNVKYFHINAAAVSLGEISAEACPVRGVL